MFITVSRRREDGDYDVLVAFNQDMDDEISEDKEEAQAARDDGDLWSALVAAEAFQHDWEMRYGEELHLHQMELVTSVVDGKVLDEDPRYKVEQ